MMTPGEKELLLLVARTLRDSMRGSSRAARLDAAIGLVYYERGAEPPKENDGHDGRAADQKKERTAGVPEL